MAKICSVCGLETIFFVWTTSRYFNLNKLFEIDKFTKLDKRTIKRFGDVVCMGCVEKHGLMNK